MAQKLLQNPQSGQKVYVDDTNPDYQSYLGGGFVEQTPVAPPAPVVPPPVATTTPVTPTVPPPVAPPAPTPITPAPASPVTPETPPITPTPPASNIPFIQGLNDAQKQSITLLSNKPASQWTDVDKKNWAFATNNSPVPGGTILNPVVPPAPVTPTASPTSGLTDAQKQQLDIASQRVAQGTATETDKQNLAFAKTKYGYTSPSTTGGNLPDGKADQTQVEDPFVTQVKSLLAEYGITAPDPAKNPVTEFAKVYQDLYEQLGLSDIKAQYEKVLKEQSDLQNELNEKIQEVTDDPWLDDATRAKKINKLNKSYEGKLNTLTNQQKLFQGLYSDGKQEAQFIAQQANTMTYQNANMAQDVILKAITEAENLAEAQAKLANPEHSTIYKEWIDYKSTGGKLGFNDYQTMDANRKRSTTNVSITPEQFTSVKTILEATKGVGGYVNTDTYKQQRNLAKDKTSFDKNYSYLLNPKDPSARDFFTATELKGDQLNFDDIQ